VNPTRYWVFFSQAFQYVRRLPAEEFRNLRLHTYHIDGGNYQQLFFSLPDGFRLAIDYLQQGLPDRFRLAAPQIAGEYGHSIDGRLINDTTLRWQKLFRSLWLAGELDRLSRQKRPVFLEIGGGYGSLAHAILSAFPRALYLIVDLPETLLFSASYLSLVHGPNRIHLLEPGTMISSRAGDGVSVILIPNFELRSLKSMRFDLSINIQSFQEMSAPQIQTYLEFLSDRSVVLLSCNHDRNHFSDERIDVTRSIRKRFRVKRLPPPFEVSPVLSGSGPRRARIAIFGAGAAGVRCSKKLIGSKQFQITAVIDNDRRKQGQRLAGIPIEPPERLARRNWDFILIASAFYPDIIAQLIYLGYTELRHFAVFEEPRLSSPSPLPILFHRYNPLIRPVDERTDRVLATPKD